MHSTQPYSRHAYRSSRWLLCCLAVVLGGCVSPKESVEWKPAADRPVVLDFRFGGAFSIQTRYVANGVRACREIGEPRQLRDGSTDYPVRRQLQVSPPPERWLAFWRTVDRLEVARWKGEYAPRDLGVVVHDGTQWWVDLSTLHHTSKSKGDNTYPTLGDPKRSTMQTTALEDLQKAFDTLIHG